jgi:N-acetylglucosaminyldiphosphoundecaprenol N-acetyl-beta-D-mannosaminyltransferase
MHFNKLKLSDIEFINSTKTSVIQHISTLIDETQKAAMFFVNANNFTVAYTDESFHSILCNAPYVFADGIGMKIAFRVFDQNIQDNINGTDLFPMLCELMDRKKYSVYFLGSKPGVVEKLITNIERQYKNITIAGFSDGYFNRETETQKVIESINALTPDILLVGMGTPFQEKWITEFYPKIHATIIMGVGGLFDFYSGDRVRAPKIIRIIGLEWFFRMIQEPGRLWKRYILGIPKFFTIVLKLKYKRA